MGTGLSTSLRIALISAAVVIVLVVVRIRGLSLRDDVGLRLPPARDALVWLVIWVVWLVVSELLSARMGVAAPARWAGQSAGALALRSFAIVVLAPVAEELVFRGVLYNRLAERLGATAAVVLTAGLFAVLHVQYRREQLLLVFADGLLLGAARATSGSVLLTMLMHAIGNAVAVYQRLPVGR